MLLLLYSYIITLKIIIIKLILQHQNYYYCIRVIITTISKLLLSHPNYHIQNIASKLSHSNYHIQIIIVTLNYSYYVKIMFTLSVLSLQHSNYYYYKIIISITKLLPTNTIITRFIALTF